MKQTKLEEFKQIGARIKEVRQSKKMSQKELALKANLSVSHMSEIESGKQALMLSTFTKVVEALGVPADELLWDESETKQYYSNAFREILSDCSQNELDSILEILRSVKTQIRTIKSQI